MAGFGLDANMLANTDDELKAKIGWLAYIEGAQSRAAGHRPASSPLHPRRRARNRSAEAHTVIVGNCGMLQGNVQLLPDATVDDGRLDIALLRPETLFTWAADAREDLLGERRAPEDPAWAGACAPRT